MNLIVFSLGIVLAVVTLYCVWQEIQLRRLERERLEEIALAESLVRHAQQVAPAMLVRQAD